LSNSYQHPNLQFTILRHDLGKQGRKAVFRMEGHGMQNRHSDAGYLDGEQSDNGPGTAVRAVLTLLGSGAPVQPAQLDQAQEDLQGLLDLLDVLRMELALARAGRAGDARQAAQDLTHARARETALARAVLAGAS
jgi:hypothetical protein